MNEQPTTGALEAQDVRRTIIIDPVNQTSLTVANAAETVIVDPITGSRVFQSTSTMLVTVDGPMVPDPMTTVLFACALCGSRPFTSAGVVRCSCGSHRVQTFLPHE